MGGKISDLQVETFVNATEDESRVREAVFNLIGEEVELDRQTIEGTFGNPILVLRARLSRKKDVDRVIGRIVAKEYFARSLNKLEDRMDEHGVYHIRLDKASAYNGAPCLWERGESIEIKFKATTYPFSRSGALELVRGLERTARER